MSEILQTAPTVAVLSSEYRRMLGYPVVRQPSVRAADHIEAITAWFAEHGRAWTYRVEVAVECRVDQLWLAGKPFPSPALHAFCARHGVTRMWATAVSPGPEIVNRAHEQWIAGHPDEYFFAEVYGSAVAESLLTGLAGEICALGAEADLLGLEPYLPGYDQWDITEQPALLQLLRENAAAAWPEKIETLDSGMVRPKKTLLALFPLAPRALVLREFPTAVPCRNCAHPACALRRQDYKHFPTSPVRAKVPQVAVVTSPLRADAPYSLNRRALRKWTEERLTLTTRADGGIEASFRFEGSTCSNLGHPLVFSYRVRLSPPSDRFRLLQADCLPGPGDEGFTQMCAYLKDPERTEAKIAEPPPLLGQPLDALFGWNREPRQTGCYCDPGSRAHKWGLALETIHFALAQSLPKADVAVSQHSLHPTS